MSYNVYDAIRDINAINDCSETITVENVYRDGNKIMGTVEFRDAIVEHSVATGEITIIDEDVKKAAALVCANLDDLLPENVDTSDIDGAVGDVLSHLKLLLGQDKRKTIDKDDLRLFIDRWTR